MTLYKSCFVLRPSNPNGLLLEGRIRRKWQMSLAYRWNQVSLSQVDGGSAAGDICRTTCREGLEAAKLEAQALFGLKIRSTVNQIQAQETRISLAPGHSNRKNRELWKTMGAPNQGWDPHERFGPQNCFDPGSSMRPRSLVPFFWSITCLQPV